MARLRACARRYASIRSTLAFSSRKAPWRSPILLPDATTRPPAGRHWHCASNQTGCRRFEWRSRPTPCGARPTRLNAPLTTIWESIRRSPSPNYAGTTHSVAKPTASDWSPQCAKRAFPNNSGDCASIRLDPRERHHLRPLRGLGGDEFLEVLGRAGEHVAAEIGEALARRLVGERSVDLFVERLDHRPWRPFRGDDAVPAVGLVARQELGHRRHAGQQLLALGAGDGERTQLAASDVAERGGHDAEHRLHL